MHNLFTRFHLIKLLLIILFIVVVLLILFTLNIFAYHAVSGTISTFWYVFLTLKA